MCKLLVWVSIQARNIGDNGVSFYKEIQGIPGMNLCEKEQIVPTISEGLYVSGKLDGLEQMIGDVNEKPEDRNEIISKIIERTRVRLEKDETGENKRNRKSIKRDKKIMEVIVENPSKLNIRKWVREEMLGMDGIRQVNIVEELKINRIE